MPPHSWAEIRQNHPPSHCLNSSRVFRGAWPQLAHSPVSGFHLPPVSQVSRVVPSVHTTTPCFLTSTLSLFFGSTRGQSAVDRQALLPALGLDQPLALLGKQDSCWCDFLLHRHLLPLPLHSGLRLQTQRILELQGPGLPHKQ